MESLFGPQPAVSTGSTPECKRGGPPQGHWRDFEDFWDFWGLFLGSVPAISVLCIEVVFLVVPQSFDGDLGSMLVDDYFDVLTLDGWRVLDGPSTK